MENKLIFHIDMNSFFASCEQVKNPALKNSPIAVVGDASRRSGIVLAASYEAKAYGVKTTMPINQALNLLPSLNLVTSSFGLYTQQLSFFEDNTPKASAQVDKMVDRVREKFGYNAIARASILDKNQRKPD